MSNTQSWAPYARDILRRLRHAQTVVTDDLFDEAKQIVPVEDPPARNLMEALSELEEAQTRDSQELVELREVGIDGWAMDENGNDSPQQRIPADKVLVCLQLAATFRTHRDFCERVLAPGAVNVIDGFKMNQMETAATQIGRLFLPEGWAGQTYAAKSATSPALQIISPPVGNSGTLSPNSQREFKRKVLSSLAQPHPLLILLPDELQLDPNLRHVLPKAQRLAAVDRDMMLMLLAETHSATRKIDRDVVRPLLPDGAALKSLDTPILLASLRAPTAAGAAKQMSDLLHTPVDPNRMTLQDINGHSPAHRAAEGLVDDLAAWRAGETKWSDISHSLLISGEPGTGKSFLARAIAASADVPLVQGSFGSWQATGHLGDMLGAMTKSFAEAISQKPCVLFVDELDAAGSRDSADKHSSNYRRNVINHFLAEVDVLMRAEGVLLIGACNHPGNLDPAILRPGRFDHHAELGRPPLAQIQHMISRVLPGDTKLEELARAFAGQTPAEIDAQLRSARSTARRAGGSFDAAWVLAHLPAATPQMNARQRRIALHESGHAIAAALLRAVPVTRMVLSNGTGQTHRSNVVHEGLLSEFEDEMTILLAGRSAERLTLGTISAGAGGDDGSDLQLATQLLLSCDRQAGLGIHGNSWLGKTDMSRLTQHNQDRLRVKLDKMERRALRLLEPHRERLERLAAHLLKVREMDAEDLRPWLEDLIPSARPPIDSPQAGSNPS
ncbi:AAA family ATPase [Tritonibacter scottomollicae]|uniref:ATP-dependent Zn protease n=1 Tax=Tritonibacter scottomollicae TaxID=483013 RepID=A0A2T1A2Y9_TRISK|nr:AAA family ATPase [Tritonibacter scottomollicae]PRZ42904.1 ATP-dependent Zn protease [Tritonibacter scottomollicae]